jgi:hypothetical protein
VSIDEAPVLDLAVIVELRRSTGDDDEFMADLVGSYLAEGDTNLEDMAAAVA